MSNWIPKEKLTAYQRWEIAAFDERPEEDTPAAESPAGAVPEAPRELAPEPESMAAEPAVVMPTAEELERVYQEAHASGYAAGHEEGIRAVQAVSERFAALTDGLSRGLAEIEQQVAEQLLALAIEIASQVVRQSLHIRPELLLPVVREALTTLHLHHGQPLLFVNPDDAALVRSHLGEQLAHSSWRIVEDRTLTAGGCRLQLGASEVDATLETRWRRVIEAIGVNQEWLDERMGRPTRSG